MEESSSQEPVQRVPRTLDQLLEMARAAARGVKLSKTEVAEFMSDLIALDLRSPTEHLGIQIHESLSQLGFYSAAPSIFRITPGNVHVPVNASGNYNPHQAGALAGALFRAAREAHDTAVKTPAELAASEARLRALLPSRDNPG